MKNLGLVDLGYNSFLFDDCMTEYVFSWQVTRVIMESC
jgi:hypothetical protein